MPRLPILLVLALFGCSSSQPSASPASAPAPATTSGASALPAAERAAFDGISEQTLRSVVSTLSSHQMEGRGTATPGGERAARWIADRWRSFGLAPAGDSGSFLQGIRFVGATARQSSQIRAGAAQLALGSDFVPYINPSTDSLDITGPVLFVSYGVKSPALKRDDFAGVDPRGKIVVLLAGKPDAMDSALWAQNAGVQRAIPVLLGGGAKAVLMANVGTPLQTYETIAGYLTRRRVTLDPGTTAPQSGPVLVFLSNEGASKLWQAAGKDFAESKRKADAGESASIEVAPSATVALRFTRDRSVGSNVAGVLRGSDPVLAEQAVVYTAHYDAFGTGADGRLYPGAADNALGVAMITAVAEVMSKQPQRPRRSVIFLAVTGEEHGLFGAEYWAAHPTWPLAKIAGDINLDGIGTETYGPVEHVIGWGAEHSTLGPLLRRVAEETGNELAPDPFPEENIFVRSDHYAMVKAGIPALMLLGAPADTAWRQRAKAWLSGPYHQPGDSIRTDWDWRGPRELAGVSAVLGLRMANADSMPTWFPLSPFNKPRGAGATP
jgi:hypothetical protein